MTLQLIEEVPLGHIKVNNLRSVVFAINNLSSGIALILYDPIQYVAGIAHILLPASSLVSVMEDNTIPGKFADLAIPELVQQYLEKGAQKQNTVAKIVGGSQLFNFGGGGTNALNIGTRNAVAIRANLSKQGIAIEKADVGGNKGRKITFHISTGKLTVSIAGQEDYEI